MSEGQKMLAGLLLYVLGIVVTFGHAHAYYTLTNDCGEKVFCSSPGERAFFSSMFWPMYWSMTAWRAEP